MTGLSECLGSASQSLVRLAEEDPDLFAGLGGRALDQAQARVVVRTFEVEPGPWRVDETADQADHPMGLIILRGFLLRTVSYHGRHCSELLGPGDIVRPWEHEGSQASIPFDRSWDALQTTRLGVLDDRFQQCLAQWPALMSALLGRGLRRAHWLALQLAITDLRRVDERLESLLWHAADRWGTVRPDGVHVPLAVTHDVLAQLVAAQRPTVTAAVQTLKRQGVVRRLRDRSWLLLQPPPDRLGVPVAERQSRADIEPETARPASDAPLI